MTAYEKQLVVVQYDALMSRSISAEHVIDSCIALGIRQEAYRRLAEHLLNDGAGRRRTAPPSTRFLKHAGWQESYRRAIALLIDRLDLEEGPLREHVLLEIAKGARRGYGRLVTKLREEHRQQHRAFPNSPSIAARLVLRRLDE